MTDEHDGNAFLGIAIGLAVTLGLVGTVAAFFASGAWRFIGVLTLLAAVMYLSNIVFGDDR